MQEEVFAAKAKEEAAAVKTQQVHSEGANKVRAEEADLKQSPGGAAMAAGVAMAVVKKIEKTESDGYTQSRKRKKKKTKKT